MENVTLQSGRRFRVGHQVQANRKENKTETVAEGQGLR